MTGKPALKTKNSPLSAIGVQSFHGAGTRVDLSSTAFGLREKHFLVSIVAAWDDGDKKTDVIHQRWAKDVSCKLASSAFPGGYPNLLGPDEQAQSTASYGANGDRLLDVKHRLDPENIFTATTLPLSPLQLR